MNTATITVADVEKKREGTSENGRPWSLWHIHSAEGPVFATFDGGYAQQALQAVGCRAVVEYEATKYGTADLKTFAIEREAAA